MRAAAKRKVRRQTGVFNPACFYTKAGIMRALGLGYESLRLARQSGLVSPILVGQKVVYDGQEIAAWLRSLRGKGVKHVGRVKVCG